MESNPNFSQEHSKPLDLRNEVLKYLPFWFWFVGFIIVALLVANIYLRYTPNTYETTAKIKILDNSNSSFRMPSDGISIFARSKTNISNELEVLKSYRILGIVVEELDLMNSYYVPGRFIKTEVWETSPLKIVWHGDPDKIKNLSTYFTITIAKNGYEIEELSHRLMYYNKQYSYGDVSFTIVPKSIINNNVGGKIVVQKTSFRSAIASLFGSITAGNTGDEKESEIIKVSMRGLNDRKLEDIVNNLIRIFNEDGVKDRQLASKNTIEFVNDRFSYLVNELDSIENYKVAYKKSNKLTFLEENATITTTKKSAVEDQLFEIENQISLAKFLGKSIKIGGDFDLLPSDIGITNANIYTFVAEYNSNVTEYNKLLISAGKNNPTVTVLAEKLIALQRNIFTSIKDYKEKLNASLNNLNGLEAQNDVLYGSIPEKEKVIRSIERQQKIKENLYLLLLQKREEAAINLAITAPSVKIVEYALSGGGPIAPNRNTIYLLALLIGFLIPFIILFIRFYLDNKIHVGKDISRIAPRIPVLAEIPFIHQINKHISENDRSVLAESYRNLRTNIDFLLPFHERKEGYVLFSTSSVKGEGKTFNAMNMAIIFTQMKKRVLLVGADLRNPQIHKYLDIDKSRAGLSSYLFNPSIDYKSLIIPKVLNNPNLDVIISGVIPPNPAELLSNGRFDILLEEARKEYDYVIVDSAPTLLVTDTLLIANLADLVVYVTRADVTEEQLVEYSRGLNEDGKIKHMAYIVNSIGWMNVYGYSYKYNYNYGYSYRYNYNYGYGYGYGSDEDQDANTENGILNSVWSKTKQFFNK
ncbi:GumC family protein [Flavobacterium sp.]|uniref:GumC family protein n=1 Tax=Flavobacterium sp. TaxID=239 RepID=UPI0038D10892